MRPFGSVRLVLTPTSVVRALLWTVAVLVGAHLAVTLIYAATQHPLFGLRRLFDMNQERSIPTLFSTLLLLGASGLLAWIAHGTRSVLPDRRAFVPWAVLAVGFLVMAVDESAGIHDGIVQASLRSRFGRGEGVFYLYWYWLYAPLVVAIAALYVPFLRRLPRVVALRFVVAGAVYLGGAIGVEMLTAAGLEGEAGLTLSMLHLVEETLEMVGVVLFIRALLLYLASMDGRIRILLGEAPMSAKAVSAPVSEGRSRRGADRPAVP